MLPIIYISDKIAKALEEILGMSEVAYVSIMAAAFIFSIMTAAILTKFRKYASYLIYALALIILIWKSVEFGIYGMNPNGTRPIEFSHISYFILGIVIVFGLKPLYPFAGFCSFLSGLVYMISAFVAPASLMRGMTGYLLPFAMTTHSLLFLEGLLIMLAFVKFRWRQLIYAFIGSACIIGYGLLVNKGIIFPDAPNRNSSTLLQLIDGTILENIAPGIELDTAAKDWSRIGAAAIYSVFMLLYFIANIQSKKIVSEEADDIGILSLIKKKIVEKEYMF